MEAHPNPRSPAASAALALLVLSLPLTAQSDGLRPASGEPGRRPVATETADYAVHEWGTFTTVLDPEGRALAWNPFGFFAPLPGFVHKRFDERKPSFWGTVRMETPVVYVHAERALTIDVHVSFPDGSLTEWYPAAAGAPKSLAWSGLEVEPRLETVLPTDLAGEHYYAARGVSAAHLRARSGETEKFLFYRGVGSFEQPLAVRSAGDGDERAFVLENRGAQALDRVFLFERREAGAALVELRGLAPGASQRVARRELALGDDVSLAPLERLLRAHGLFEDEAQAMLATWRRDWFEPGLRVLYVLPRARTDEVLPLALAPAPKELARVLVGRLELIEPELERELLAAAREVAAGSARPDEAFGRVGAPTRFALAVLQARYAAEPMLQAAEWPLVTWLRASSAEAPR